MTTRDEYVAKLKTQLDRWNADVTRWEDQAKSAQAQLKAEYAKQLETLHAQQELARYQMKLLESASATAWTELSKGADEAWDKMRAAIGQARAQFEARAPKKTH
jgi:hypothetical protein